MYIQLPRLHCQGAKFWSCCNEGFGAISSGRSIFFVRLRQLSWGCPMFLRGAFNGVVRSVAKCNGTATRLPSGGVGMRVGSLGDGTVSLSTHVTPTCHRGRVRVHGRVTHILRHKGISFDL